MRIIASFIFAALVAIGSAAGTSFFVGNPASIVQGCCPAPPWPVAASTQIVGTGGTANTNQNSPVASQEFITRAPVVLGGYVQQIVLSFDLWSIDGTGAALNPSQSLTISGVCLEQVSPSYSVRVTFNGGSNSVVLNPGDTQIKSDPILAPSFGLSYFSPDATYYYRGIGVVAGTGTYPIGTPISGVPGARMFTYDPANHIDQVCGTGLPRLPTGGSSTATGYGPTAVLGKFYNPPGQPLPLSVFVTADSFLGADSGIVPLCGPSFMRRASCDASGQPASVIAMATAGHGGINCSQIKNNTKVLGYLQYANVLYNELSANDINDGHSAATVFSDCQAIWTAARNAGVQKVLQFQAAPRVTWIGDPALGFTNTTDQQYQTANWQPGGSADQLNALYAAAVPATIDGVPQTNVPIRDTVFTLKWLPNATPNNLTSDGVHPDNNGPPLMATPLRTMLQSLTVNYLLERDINPAASDNVPAFLTAAA